MANVSVWHVHAHTGDDDDGTQCVGVVWKAAR